LTPSETLKWLETATGQEAFMFFLIKEKRRHFDDIIRASKDIAALKKRGVKIPDDLNLDIWIEA
jgi:hypothetical protein